MSILNKFAETLKNKNTTDMTLDEYLELCKTDKLAYSSAPERMLAAIGEPEMVDTTTDERLRRIHKNRVIPVYKSFSDFYGMEKAIEQVVSYYRHAAQGLEERKQILYLLGPVGGGKCLVKGTSIAMKDGDYKPIEQIAVGDWVISHNNYNQKVFKQVTHVFDLGIKPTLRVTTKRGRVIEGAETHKLFNSNGWTAISELRVGELIALANEHNFGGETREHDQLAMYGYLLGDGNIGTYKNAIQFANVNPTIIQEMTEICSRAGISFNTSDGVNYRLGGLGKASLVSNFTTDGLMDKYSYEKVLPEWIMRLNRSDTATFLSRLYATDGWASLSCDTSRMRGDGRYVSKHEIGYCTTSKVMAEQIINLLAKFGIIASIRSRAGSYKGQTHRDAYSILITSSENVINFANNIGIYGKDSAIAACLEHARSVTKLGTTGRVIPKNIAYAATETTSCSKLDGSTRVKDMIRTTLNDQQTVSRMLIHKLHSIVGGDDLAHLLDENYYWDSIASIEVVEAKAMYDFTVEGFHNYIANGFISHNSSIAERLKTLMQKFPVYVLSYKHDDGTVEVCPNFESPLNLFDPVEYAEQLFTEYGIHRRYLTGLMGPWVQKRLKEANGDMSRFIVRKLFPSKLEQVCIAKTEPGDENNQDISDLVGKCDIRKLKQFSQNDADAYAFSGGLCRANQGLLEFVEMFKAPIKVLHPLLTATQEGNYNGTESLPAIPFQGMILAHSNESEWDQFKGNQQNEAFLDRVYIVKVPYCLRVTEEELIYAKMLKDSSLASAPCAPHTLKMLAEFMILTRLNRVEHSDLKTKMRVYDGINMKDVDPHAKPIDEYQDAAGPHEGMSGWSTRTAFKLLAKVFNFEPDAIGANPVHLMYVIETAITDGEFGEERQSDYRNSLKNIIQAEYYSYIGKEIQTAYLESYSEYGQNIFDRYVSYADSWLHENEFRDPDTSVKYSVSELDKELSKIESGANIMNVKDFRNEIVNFSLRYRAQNGGSTPAWNEYNKIKEVIEQRMFSSTEDLLPIISFNKKGSSDHTEKHEGFVQRMVERGYTERQVRLLVEWYIRYSKSN